MTERSDRTYNKTVDLRVVKPYDFKLTLQSLNAFRPGPSLPETTLRLAARIGGSPVIIEIGQDKRAGKVEAAFHPKSTSSQVRAVAEWVLFAELDLAPFYRLTAKDPKLEGIVKRLRGLKPSRPVSLFEMAVTAITEQQISLASAYAIRNRLVQMYGEPIEDLRVFPEPEILAKTSPEKLRSVGLSRQKVDYIQTLASNIASGTLELDALKHMGDDEARELIVSWKGFGPWSADYILIRGLARPDCVPVDDLGIRDVIGSRFLKRRATADEVAKELEPYRPYRGLLAFYLLAAQRLELKTPLEKNLNQD